MLVTLWVAFLLSCQKVAGLDDGSLKFAGIERIDQGADQTYVLTWNKATGSFSSVRYQIFYRELDQSFTIDNAQSLGGRPFVIQRGAQLQAVEAGALLAEVASDQTSFSLNVPLEKGNQYAFWVIARDDQGGQRGADTIAMLGARGVDDYSGCLSYEPLTDTQARISVDFPFGASAVLIFVDGLFSARIENQQNDSIVVSGLRVGTEHKIECRAVTGNEVLVGSNVLSLSTVDPFAGYVGCLEAEATAAGAVSIKFEFPENAQRVSLYRDGVKIHDATSRAHASFLDIGGSPGNTHTYSCEAVSSAIAKRGSRQLAVEVPDLWALFDGCLQATPIGSSQVRVEFSMPEGANKLTVLRGGTPVFSTINRAEIQYIDGGLTEGRTYRYNCEASTEGRSKRGRQEIEVRTLSSNPPSFDGITDAVATDPRKVRVSWGVVNTNSVSAKEFHIYANPGFLIDWDAPPRRIVPAGSLEAVLEGLGDQLPYAFAVRACGANDLCEQNTVTRQVTMPDGGAPLTSGISQLEIVGGKIRVTAPWTEAAGSVQKRRLYRMNGTGGGTNLANYTLVKTLATTSAYEVPEVIVDDTISENSSYSYLLVDQDTLGQNSIVHPPKSISTGDLTPPAFPGLAALKKGPIGKFDSAIVVEFTAIDPEVTPGDNGGKDYLIFVKQNGGDACALTTPDKVLPVSGYVPGTTVSVTIDQLTSRKQYSVCVKARDAAGNVSTTTAYLSRYVLDVTPPSFDGVQSMQYNPATSKFDVVWNASTSADVREYKVKLWKTDLNPPADAVVHLNKAHASFSGGFAFGQTTVNFLGGDVFYVLVDACDDAHFFPDGVQNCTSLSVPVIYNVPDVTPPQGFGGVATASAFSASAEGTVTVAWLPPANADWTDYSGFKIYHVNLNAPTVDESAMTYLGICPCSGHNCPNEITSCTLTVNDDFRTYAFHVRAYDANGNETTYLSPAVSYTEFRSRDDTDPTFSANVSVSYADRKIAVTWGSASDNQYAFESSAVLRYSVYRRTGVNFSNLADPAQDLDVVRLGQVDNLLTYSDAAIESNVRYYYTVCVEDGSGHAKCLGSAATFETPDVVPPQILTLTSSKLSDANAKVWDLAWTLSDNSPVSSLAVSVYRHSDPSPVPPATFAEYEEDITTNEEGLLSLEDLSGSANVDEWVHYLVRVSDSAGLTDEKRLSLYSDNKVLIQAVKRPQGPDTGGRLMIIEGQGFGPGAKIFIGDDTPCYGKDISEAYFFNKQRIGCLTPPLAAGSYKVKVENLNGSGSHEVVGAYTYVTPGVYPAHPCDDPAVYGASPFASGNGSSAGNARLICTAAQLAQIPVVGKGYVDPAIAYYKLGDNIDLNGVDLAPLYNVTNDASFGQAFRYSSFDGQGLYVANYKRIQPGTDYVGLFRVLNASSIKDFGVLGFEVQGRTRIGGISGHLGGGCGYSSSNLYAHGKVLFSTYGGLAFGGVSTTVSDVVTDGEVLGVNTPGVQSRVGGGFAGAPGSGCAVDRIRTSGNYRIMNESTPTWTQVGGIYGDMTDGSLSDSESSAVIVSDGSEVGGISGRLLNRAIVTNSRFSGSVTGRGNVGGIVGHVRVQNTDHFMRVNDNTVTGRVHATETSSGGIVGGLLAGNIEVKNNEFSGEVSAGVAQAGGIVGSVTGNHIWTTASNGALISGNVNSGHVSGPSHVGGIAGAATCTDSTLARCTANASIDIQRNRSTAAATIKSVGEYVGGIVGYAQSRESSVVIRENVNLSPVEGGGRVGGIVGHLSASMLNNYSHGTVKAGQSGGSIVGFGYTFNDLTVGVNSWVKAEFNYATGLVTCQQPSSCGGGFGAFQRNRNSNSIQLVDPVLQANFFDTVTTGFTTTAASGFGGIEGKPSSQMKSLVTFNSWDAQNIWHFTPGSYPTLKWEAAP